MNDLRKELLNRGYAFEFFQAVRLLEALTPGAAQAGGQGPYSQETVHIRPNRDLAFPAGDIQKIEMLPDNPAGRDVWRITQNFMGLYGVNTPLPPYFAEMVAQNYQDPDPLRAFLDLFNHRLLGLYYQAWKKHHRAASVNPARPDKLTMALCALIGQEPGAGREDWLVAPERLVRYLGLLAGRTRSAAGLEAMISDYFGISNVRVSPYLVKKYRLRPKDITHIGVEGRNNRLGQSVVLGRRVDDVAGQFRLSLGPLSPASFDKLQPGEPAYMELVFLVHFFTRHQLDFELELILNSEDVKPFKLSSQHETNPLGRHSWLGNPQGSTVSASYNPA